MPNVVDLGIGVTSLGAGVFYLTEDSPSPPSPGGGTYYRNLNMGYTTASGRYANTLGLTVAASATLTATAASTGIELGDRSALRLDLVITAASGTTPTLDIAVQTSPDNATWTAVASFAQQTTTTTGVHKVFGPLDRFVRINSTIGGTTPSFTFSVSGEAV